MTEVVDTENSTMTLHGHIREARQRIFVVALAFIVFSSLAYVFRDEIIAVLLQPLQGQKLSYLSPGGGFNFIFKVSMWVGIAASFPVAIYSLYKFVSPILPKRVRRYSVLLLFCSSLLLVTGVVFGYYLAIPGAIHFLLSFASNYVEAMLTADSYLSFILAYTLGLGIIFQIPLILLIIHWIKPLKPKQLMGFERYVIVIAFVVAAVITPTPDPTNQFIMAMPMIALYQAGLATVGVSVWREKRALRKQAKRVPYHEPVEATVVGRKVTPSVSGQVPQAKPHSSERKLQPAVSSARQRSKTQYIDGFRVVKTTSRGSLQVSSDRPEMPLRPSTTDRSTSLQPALRYARSIDGISRPRQISPLTLRTSR